MSQLGELNKKLRLDDCEADIIDFAGYPVPADDGREEVLTDYFLAVTRDPVIQDRKTEIGTKKMKAAWLERLDTIGGLSQLLLRLSNRKAVFLIDGVEITSAALKGNIVTIGSDEDSLRAQLSVMNADYDDRRPVHYVYMDRILRPQDVTVAETISIKMTK